MCTLALRIMISRIQNVKNLMRLLTFRQFKFSRASDAANFVAFVNKQNKECRVLKDKVNLSKAQGSFFEPKPYRNRIKYMTFRPLTSMLSARCGLYNDIFNAVP